MSSLVTWLPSNLCFQQIQNGKTQFSPSLLNLAEISGRPFLSRHHQNNLKFPLSSGIADGNTRPRRVLRNANKPQSYGGKEPDHRAIIDALGKQLAKAKEKSTHNQKINSNASGKEQLDVLSAELHKLGQLEDSSKGKWNEVSQVINGKSKKEKMVDYPSTILMDQSPQMVRPLTTEKVGGLPSKAEVKVNKPPSNFVDLLQQSGSPSKKKEIVDSPSPAELNVNRHRKGQSKKKGEAVDLPSPAEVQVNRPPSKFVKRSPFQVPSIARVQDEVKVPEEELARVQDEVKDPEEELEKLKLSALREIARSKGIKNYAKFKKADLVELLKKS